ncbi:MAG: 50S ribosomal protein L33 [Pseudothermotoga sp.]|uniref:Large ribosomal subunit protein bL33 n=2 Tax=Pseudothermotoga hypogea TaxID=57487 RepID=A0A0X1KNW0_9THEM|nr:MULTISPECIES: 50S ribosomal protein L33 [Pseudothermotoga]KUK03639.1 MAG: 50S ribosomal protein L33 [Thermotoga sp. 50_64]AJC72909.1 50S ribosomal protein L33 [Pseudothermotoga hypogea DSM 11164 = NBRC 106472]MBC7117170.1 50S ribosomal protein L33 [Pseudothermotoga sp.]MDI6862475.1 50S ribosomal protein L33 [Pseudothermotoga sp.]HBT40213.1 50S ribosomal protein L33 [Pseudothermotoga sp.]
MTIKIALKCSVCGHKNYYTEKNNTKKTKLSLRKYCPNCNKHTEHVETK